MDSDQLSWSLLPSRVQPLELYVLEEAKVSSHEFQPLCNHCAYSLLPPGHSLIPSHRHREEASLLGKRGFNNMSSTSGQLFCLQSCRKQKNDKRVQHDQVKKNQDWQMEQTHLLEQAFPAAAVDVPSTMNME